MTSPTTANPHWSFWIINALFLLWNLMGCVNLYLQMSLESMQGYRQVEQEIIELRPIWATVAFAIAVIAGTIGCLFLLFRRKTALYAFVVSLIAILITLLPSITSGMYFGIAEIVAIIVLPVLIGAFLIVYTRRCTKKGWLR